MTDKKEELFSAKIIVNIRIYSDDPMLAKYLEQGIKVDKLTDKHLISIESRIAVFLERLKELYQ